MAEREPVRREWLLSVLVVAVVVLAGCSGLAPSSTPSGGDGVAAPGDSPDDPATDRLGWEDGVWYNESIAVQPNDGLDSSERSRLVARAMARVERLRRLEFQESVPVEVTTRRQFASQVGGESVPAATRRIENAKYEAMFMINESADAVAVKRGTTRSSVAGFYSPSSGEIVLVTDPGGPVRIDELTLAHELVHALQDQHFSLGDYERSTREAKNEISGLVEGDANLVQHRYERRCRNAWEGECLAPTAPAGHGGDGSLAGLGPFLVRFQPYSDGPAFVRSLYRSGGWTAVNAAYGDPPASTEQTIHPRLYGEDQPTSVTVADRSSAAWRRVDGQGPGYAALGEAGMASMMVYPALATGGEMAVVPAESFLAGGGGLDPYNYSTPYTAGWDGDRLVVYASEGTPRGETGYVWKTAWDSPAEAREFADGYRQLLRLHGARRVAGPSNAWVIPPDSGFADAFRLERRGDTVVVVNAPTVEGLVGVRAPPGG